MPIQTVALVLDPEYGENLKNIAARASVWVIDSPANKCFAQSIWAMCPNSDHTVTTFIKKGVFDDSCLEDLMDNVELHHPRFRTLEILGLAPTTEVRRVLKEFGFDIRNETRNGLLATRISKSPD